MEVQLRTVLVPVDNKEAVEKVREIIKEIDGNLAPEFWNDTMHQFQFFGTMVDALPCMAAGASSVS